jgi:hypothetical protein
LKCPSVRPLAAVVRGEIARRVTKNTWGGELTLAQARWLAFRRRVEPGLLACELMGVTENAGRQNNFIHGAMIFAQNKK